MGDEKQWVWTVIHDGEERHRSPKMSMDDAERAGQVARTVLEAIEQSDVNIEVGSGLRLGAARGVGTMMTTTRRRTP